MGGTLLRKLSEASLIVKTKLIFWNHPYSYLESKCIFIFSQIPLFLSGHQIL
jgi:hypothetical protein